ncbi:MAG: glycosyltransferase family 2 protein [Bacteroidales bacterium]|nr:glycosyltransferase family 2 protein [Syntrophomonas sp.]MDD4002012.1 glycosyltransferase family 2 protein [Bacteroidales bacterium]
MEIYNKGDDSSAETKHNGAIEDINILQVELDEVLRSKELALLEIESLIEQINYNESMKIAIERSLAESNCIAAETESAAYIKERAITADAEAVIASWQAQVLLTEHEIAAVKVELDTYSPLMVNFGLPRYSPGNVVPEIPIDQVSEMERIPLPLEEKGGEATPSFLQAIPRVSMPSRPEEINTVEAPVSTPKTNNGFIRMGDNLLRLGYISEQQLEIALIKQKENGKLIGEVLVENGFISAQELTEFITTSQYSKLGERLIEAKAITKQQLKAAISFQTEKGGRLGDVLVSLGFIDEKFLTKFISSVPKVKLPLGKILIEANEITKEQLDKAIMMQEKSGGRLGDILLYLKYITPERLCRYLATQNNIGRIGEHFNQSILTKIPYDIAIKYNALVINVREDAYILAVNEILNKDALEEIKTYLDKPVEQVLATMVEIENFWEIIYDKEQTEESVFKLYDVQPENSAIITFTKSQRITSISIVSIFIMLLLINYKVALLALNLIFQAIYALMTILKLFIVFKGSTIDGQLHFSKEEIAEIDESKLPVYTILIPVYKEKEVIKQLIYNIQNLDYPQYKLDVCILLEEDDVETIEAVKAMNLPHHYTTRIVPPSEPKTKPKACNYGLIRAKGEYVVIYDAEDRPEPDQLKKVYLSFEKMPDSYVCMQCKLNYFNSNQNVLTRLFTQEYSMWFELLLVGVMQLKTPIPLGGTSNHFKAEFLREIGAWDPFNVTEDADLGIRLFKKGYYTAIVDSRTWEEANSNVMNWLKQRSRWIKGYMQTWLVHMRHPVQLYKACGLEGFIGYQAMILGTPLLPLINPIFWTFLILWYLTKANWISDLFPGIFYYIASFQLLAGNAIFAYTNALGMYWVLRSCSLDEKQPFSYVLIKYALLSPFYWILMSVAANMALIQLITKPFYWEKTQHGLTSIQHDTVKEMNMTG